MWMHKVSDEPWLYIKLHLSFVHYASYYNIIVLNTVLAHNFREITERSRIAEERFRHKHGLKTGINFPEFMCALGGFI